MQVCVKWCFSLECDMSGATAHSIEKQARSFRIANIGKHARSQVDAALEEARGALRAQAEDLAREVAQRVLGRTLS